MKTIAIMIEKGGAGKTTTAAAVAHILARNHSVLAIDADQQGNLSTLFGVDDPEDKGLAALLESVHGETTVADVAKESPYGLDVIPANGYLMDTNMEIAADEQHDQVRRLRDALENSHVAAAYDYVVIDCGLLLDMTVLNALVAADLVVVPVKVGGFEAQALQRIAEQAGQLRALNPHLELRSFMTMRAKNRSAEEFEAWLKSYDQVQAFQTTVSRSVMVERASIYQQPVTAYRPGCKASKEYVQLTREIEEVLA